MRIRNVNPNHIKVPEVRVTSRWDSDALAEFKASIKSLGILEPPVCIESDGDLFLVDGLHRVVTAINQGETRIPVVVMEGDMKDVLLQNLALNNLRGSTSPLETAQVLKSLYDDYGLGVDEISRRTGFSEERISRLLYLAKADEGVRSALDEGLIQLGHAYALARIQDPEVQKRVLSTQLLYHFKVADLEGHIRDVMAEKERLEQAPPPTARGEVPQPVCYFCRRSFPVDQLANPNICIGCSGYLADALRQAAALREAERVAAEAERAG